MKTRFLFLFLSTFLFFISCDSTPDVQPEQELNSTKQLLSFTLEKSKNANYLEEDIVGIVDNGTIKLTISEAINTTKLIATFTHNGEYVLISGTPQVSGETVNDFTKLMAYTVVAEDKSTEVFSVNITWLGEEVAQIPRIYIDTEDMSDITVKEVYKNATIRIEGGDEYEDFETTTRIRGRGNSTWGMPKKPYKLKLDSKAPILGMNSHREWAVLADYLDKTLLRNITAFEISRIAEMSWTPASVSFDLYLNGTYRGVYAMTEQVKVAKERFDIELVEPTDNSGEALTGGYLLELDFHYDEEFKFKTDKERLPIMFKDPENPTTEQFNYVKDYYNLAERVLYSDNFRDPVEGYRKYIHMESFVEYFIVQELAKNVDGNLRGSCYMSIRKNGKIELPLVWDFDLAFGNADYIVEQQGATSAEYDGWFIKTQSPWYDRLFQDPDFVAELKDRWNEMKPKLDELPSFIDKRAKRLRDSQAKNFSPKASGGAGWDIKKVLWNTDRVRGSYNAEVNYLINFVEKRIEWLDTNINSLN